jgi:hypothetical protein
VTGAVAAAVLAAVALCSGAGLVDAEGGADGPRSAPVDRTTVQASDGRGTATPVTTVWRPR